MTKRAGGNDPQQDRARFNFADAVTRAFGFRTDLGFIQLMASPTIVRYRKGDVEANIYHGRQSYELGFEIGHGGAKYPMSALIGATDPETAKQYRNFTTSAPNALAEGLTRLAGLAKQYGQQALQGNPEAFVALEKQRKSWAEEYALEVLVDQLRPKADAAFRRDDYREAAELYEHIRPHLTPAELKKLTIAKKRDQR
jgi:hypothetical protein